MHWFSNLSPGEQIMLLIQAGTAIFSAGVFYGTVRFLSIRVKEHGDRLEKHDEKLEQHGEEIAALRAAGGK